MRVSLTHSLTHSTMPCITSLLSFYTDLPIFSIHGNHDDPTRESGMEHLAALDLLAVSNLVNYFGRQDAVDKVEVSPILLEKGNHTKVALYGMGSMRDERLNRMWRGKKVRFLRPANDDQEWFHVFALHQNRDLGRGTKNCVHESMIPEWMDLVRTGIVVVVVVVNVEWRMFVVVVATTTTVVVGLRPCL